MLILLLMYKTIIIIIRRPIIIGLSNFPAILYSTSTKNIDAYSSSLLL